MKKTCSELKVFLTIIFVGCLLISNIIAAKQFLLPFNITAGGGLLVFPITYILSDIFSEVYGYRWSRITCYAAFFMNLFMVGIFQLVLILPNPDYWTNQAAFEIVLGSAPRAFIGSTLGMLAGDFVNDRVFRRMKRKHENEHKGFGARAILSSLCGEVADSSCFIPIAFLGTMPMMTLITMWFWGIITKTAYEVIILPVTNKICKTVKRYEFGIDALKSGV